ncbi:MAG: HGGxSTG domain-containing protein, partial [Dongiaceae bacterium]
MTESIKNFDPSSALPRRGWLRHGNRPGDYAKAPRCGARTRSGGCCRQPAMANGRCRMHGGLSTGPRTAEGLVRARRARWKHGYASAEIRAFRREAAQAARKLAGLIRLDRDLRRLKRA